MKFRRSRWLGAVAVIGVVGAAAAGCSSSNPSPVSPSASATSAAPEEPAMVDISVGTAAAAMDFADVYVAEQKGFFEQAGVNVTIQTGVGASGLNNLVSGQLDLLMFGVGASLIAENKGIDLKIVYNQMGAGDSGAVAVATDSPYKTITDLSGKNVAVLGVGGSSYGWGQYYSSYSAEHGGSAWNIQQAPSTSDQVNGVIAGHYDALVSTGSLFQAQIQSGQLRMLIDPGAASGKPYLPAQYAETVTFGVAKNLADKQLAVERFVAGMRAADEWLQNADPTEAANVIKGDPGWDGQSVETMALGAKWEKPFFAPSLGEIDKALWASTLKQLAFWGLPEVDLSDSKFSYENLVDMSYLDAAKSIKVDLTK